MCASYEILKMTHHAMKDGSLEWPEGTRRHPVCIHGCLFLHDTLCSLHYLLALLCLPEVQTTLFLAKERHTFLMFDCGMTTYRTCQSMMD